MLKKSNVILFLFVFLFILNPYVYAINETKEVEITYNNIQIVLDGRLVTLKDVNGNVIEPFILNGTTYLPVRGISEALGLLVDWEEGTNSVLLNDNGRLTAKDNTVNFGKVCTEKVTLSYRDIKIKLNGAEIIPKDVNGNIVEPFLIDGTTYLPIRAIANAMNMEVEWEDKTKSISLRTAVSVASVLSLKPSKGEQYEDCFGQSNVKKEDIGRIIFEKETQIPSDVNSWNASEQVQDDIRAWVTSNDISGLYDLHFCSTIGKFYAPKNSSYLFAGYSNVKEIIFDGEFNVSNAIDMSNMFAGCTSLENIDVSNWDTSNTTNMRGMFNDCNRITKLDVDNWNTERVKDLSYMFWRCANLSILNVKDWDVSNVTDMTCLFYFCSSLTNLDVSQWNTKNVIKMYSMFGYNNFSKINLNNWNTSKVEDMSRMFYHCTKLSSIIIDNIDTSRVIDMSSMFEECHELSNIDVSKWDTTRLSRVSKMFNNCNNLKKIDIHNWNISNVKDITNIAEIFEGCSNLKMDNSSKHLNRVQEWGYDLFGDSLGNNKIKREKIENVYFKNLNEKPSDVYDEWDISKYKNEDVIAYLVSTNVYGTFDLYICSQDGTFYLPANSHNLFSNFSNVKKFYGLENVDVSGVRNMSSMFSKCTRLEEIDLNTWDTSSVEDMSYLFSYCESLKSVKVDSLDVSRVNNISCIFNDCHSLSIIKVDNWNTSNVNNMSEAFMNCINLSQINVSGWNTQKVTDMSYMFYGCRNLKFSKLNLKVPKDANINSII